MNFLKLNYWKPFRSRFLFIDTMQFLGDRCFNNNQLKVKYLKGGLHKAGTDYIVTFCEIATRDEDKFFECMEQLKANMIIMGNVEYEDMCDDFFDKLRRLKESA